MEEEGKWKEGERKKKKRKGSRRKKAQCFSKFLQLPVATVSTV